MEQISKGKVVNLIRLNSYDDWKNRAGEKGNSFKEYADYLAYVLMREYSIYRKKRKKK